MTSYMAAGSRSGDQQESAYAFNVASELVAYRQRQYRSRRFLSDTAVRWPRFIP
jgi:hypothetical protein